MLSFFLLIVFVFNKETIKELALKLINQYEFMKEISEYLRNKMLGVAPNLTTLIGETVGAKLISHSGSKENPTKKKFYK